MSDDADDGLEYLRNFAAEFQWSHLPKLAAVLHAKQFGTEAITARAWARGTCAPAVRAQRINSCPLRTLTPLSALSLSLSLSHRG